RNQPKHYYIREDLRPKEYADARDDLDHADDVHKLVAVAAEHIVHERRQVLIPVHKHVKEFIQPRGYRCHYKCELQKMKRLIPCARRRFIGRTLSVRACCCHCCFHISLPFCPLGFQRNSNAVFEEYRHRSNKSRTILTYCNIRSNLLFLRSREYGSDEVR